MTPYPFTKLSDLSFEFVTSSNVTYYAYFLGYGYMFSKYPHLTNNIYSFNLDVKDGDNDKLMADERIGLTIVQIFQLFFNSQKNVAIYICDSSDTRQLARKRKFDFWFWKYNDGSIIKEDGIAVIEDTEIYNSLLIAKSNDHINELIAAFKQLNERVDNDK